MDHHERDLALEESLESLKSLEPLESGLILRCFSPLGGGL